MNTDEVLAAPILSHGAYVCGRAEPGVETRSLATLAIPELVERLRLVNEFAGAPPPSAVGSVAFLRGAVAATREIADHGVAQATWIVHVWSKESNAIEEFLEGTQKLLAAVAQTRILRGVVKAKTYTGAAMNRWAYERAVVQQPGAAMPNAYLIPLSKTAEWWSKDWMERHTYFLPRYDDAGRMADRGHALVAEAGISCMLRRTYRAFEHPAPAGSYDFITYFECADADVPVLEQVCESLRDVKQNREWAYVREGPTWRGRRVPQWADLFVTRA
ncbi:MAG: hypothetical protein DMD81_04460 [Candidatus Rokuibacteriota bacterium]|nr:MAG: hypothetical protein DMD81_04460 [Candidatus Rokubacteria bacterium]